jgi:hypothetical protein
MKKNKLSTMKKNVSIKNQLVEKEEIIILNEGFWEKSKYLLSKLGRYKAGGRILGKGQVDAEARQQIADILKKAERGFVQSLDAWIKENNPKFPNNEKEEVFLQTIEQIAATYDSIVAATKLPNTDPGFLPVDVADRIISGLRAYVKKFLDVDLTAIYSGMDEEYNYNEDIDLSEDAASDRRQELQQKRQQQGGGEDFVSSRMNTLNSNTLPLVLAGLGTALGGLSWLTTTDFFKQLFTTKSSIKEIINTLKETLNYNAIKPGEGLTQIMNRTQGLNLSPTSSPQEFLKGVAKIGGNDLKRGIDFLSTQGGIFENPAEAKRVLMDIASNPNGHGTNLGQIFQGTWAGTGAQAGDLLVTKPGGILFNMIVSGIKKTVIKTTITTGAGYLAAKGLGAFLGPLGIAAIAAGAAVKLFRMKGQKQSRAATLNLLFQTIRDITPTKENPTVTDDLDIPPPDTTQPKQPEGGDEGQGGEKGKKVKKKTPLPPAVQQVGSLLRQLFQNVYGFQQQGKKTKVVNPAPANNANPANTNFTTSVRPINEANYMNKKGLQSMGVTFDPVTAKYFIENAKIMSKLIKAIDKIDSSKLDRETQIVVNKLKAYKSNTNSVYYIFLNFNNYIDSQLQNPRTQKVIKIFLDTYIKSIKSAQFRSLKKELDKNLNIILEAEQNAKAIGATSGTLGLEASFKAFYTTLFLLFRHLNKLAAKGDPSAMAGGADSGVKKTSNYNPTASRQAAATPAAPAQDDFQTRANMGSSLEESKKKNKYSKKASEFIGKEISHLKKDKGYPQDRAVAAAINVAKEKGMKVGAKKK